MRAGVSLEDTDKVRITTTIVVEGTSFLDDSVVVRPFGHDCHATFTITRTIASKNSQCLCPVSTLNAES